MTFGSIAGVQAQFVSKVTAMALTNCKRLAEKNMTDEYQGRHAALVAYLRMKADQSDWHAVSDAANDLLALEAEYSSEPQPSLTDYSPVVDEMNQRMPKVKGNSFDRHHELLASARDVIQASERLTGGLIASNDWALALARLTNAVAECERNP